MRLAAVPRQVTAPLAIAIAGMLGADPSLAATIVVLTGLVAAWLGLGLLPTPDPNPNPNPSPNPYP